MVNRREFLKLSIGATAGLFISSKLSTDFEVESVSAEALAEGLLDPVEQPKFAYDVPRALDPTFIYQPKGHKYEVGMHPIQQELGLIDPDTEANLVTDLWGYGESRDTATFPGKTFMVHSGQPINVRWTNDLVDEDGDPVPHLLPVDTSLHWAYSLHGYEHYTIEEQGVPMVPHVHGGHTESNSDGNPEYFWSPGGLVKGPRYVKNLYHYHNDQEAGTIWYHDHALGITRLNVYAGLAGFYIIRDDQDTGEPDNPLGLPAYPYEEALVIQDRMFTDEGQLFYPAFPGDPAWADFITGEGLEDDEVPQPSALAEFFGDHILVNGVIWPKMEVEPRHYRLRLLNGSDSRFYVLQLKEATSPASHEPTGDPIPFYQIGTDDGLLYKPVQIEHVIIGPGERVDLVVDFSGFEGKRLIFENLGPDAPFGGDYGEELAEEDLFPDHDETTALIMAFGVTRPMDATVPDSFNSDAPLRESMYMVDGEAVRVRKLALFEGLDEYGRLQPLLGMAEPTENVEGETVNSSLGWFEPITENPGMNDVEIWEVYNATPDAHPIHVHLVAFELLNRQEFEAEIVEMPQPQHNGTFGVGGRLTNITLGDVLPIDDNEKGPKDTAQMYPNQVTRIKMKFDRPGRYVWHCHILSHEDHEMMRPYHVGGGVNSGGKGKGKGQGGSADDDHSGSASSDAANGHRIFIPLTQR